MARGSFEKDFHKQQQDHVDWLYEEVTDGTCQWIYQTHEYRDWIKQKRSVLCIKGSPRSGKSCLLASILAKPLGLAMGLHTNSLVMKLFRDASDEPEDFSHILQILLLEALGESTRSYIPVDLNGQVEISDEDLEEVLLRALNDIGQTKSLFLFIDDIINLGNEVDGALVPFVERLLDNAAAADIILHVCYSKRDYPPLKLPRSLVAIHHQIQIDAHNQPDVRLHVEKGVTKLFSRSGKPPELSLAEQIVEIAGTGFAVANSYLEDIEKIRTMEIRDSLMSERISPEQVHKMWEQTLQDVLSLNGSRETKAIAMMQCALAAQRPLSIEEFFNIFNIPIDTEAQEMESSLLAESLGLLHTSVNESSNDELGRQRKFISFIQPTLRKHLENPKSEDFLFSRLNQSRAEFIAEGHGFFLMKGIESLKAYLHDYRKNWKKILPKFVEAKLSLDHERNLLFDFDPIFKSYPFLKYTLNNLFIHASRMQGTDEERGLLAELHEHGDGVIETSEHLGEDHEHYTILGVWCHLNNCLQGLRIYGPSGWNYKVKTRSDQTALHWAAYYGSEQAAEVLVEQSFNDEICFFWKTKQNKKSYDVSSTYVGQRERDYKRSALHIAAAKGNVNIVTHLLDFREKLWPKVRAKLPITEVDEKFDSAWDQHLNSIEWNVPTVLEHAVEGHHATVVEKLLEHGADWRLHSGPHSPLQLAMRLAQDETTLRPATKAIVRMLKAAAFAVLDNASSLKYEAISYDKLFEATQIDIEGSDVTRTQRAIPEFLSSIKPCPGESGLNPAKSRLTWYHLPANNMRWAEILIFRLFEKNNKRDEVQRDEVLRHELWTERQIRGSERSYISFMRPGCDTINGNDFVLFMPYIHWETQEKQRELETLILCKFLLGVDPDELSSLVRKLSQENNDLLNAYADNNSGASAIATLSQEFQLFLKSVDSSERNKPSAQERLRRAMSDYKSEACVSDRDMRLIDLYATKPGDKHSLHIRRTLDQSFYHTLDSTFARNKDQVVTRYGRGKKREQPVVMMVDQLWLWCVGKTVITCFPQRRECGLDDPDRYDMTDVLENIVQKINSMSPKTTVSGEELADLIIDECIRVCFDPTKNLEDDFKFLDMFSNSISRTANGEVEAYELFVKLLKISSQQDLMDIETETSLLREMKDILDELRMIKFVFIDQMNVIEALDAQRSRNSPERIRERLIRYRPVAYNSVDRYLDKVISMQEEGERTVNSLNALMDLRQRHATLWEAKSTGKQGNTIMIFTVVTIVFLPASFMASFFALPVLQFSRTDSDHMNLTYVVKWTVIFTIPVAAFFISLAFYINDLLNALSGITGHKGRVAKKTGLGDWKNQDEIEGKYGGSAKQDFRGSGGQRLFPPVAQVENWLGKRKRRTDSLPR